MPGGMSICARGGDPADSMVGNLLEDDLGNVRSVCDQEIREHEICEKLYRIRYNDRHQSCARLLPQSQLMSEAISIRPKVCVMALAIVQDKVNAATIRS